MFNVKKETLTIKQRLMATGLRGIMDPSAQTKSGFGPSENPDPQL